jgi:hypothetical protein
MTRSQTVKLLRKTGAVQSKIRLQNGSLCYDPKTSAPRVKWGNPKLLEEFVGLAEAEDSAIPKYARRWSVLGLCKHNLPMGHPQLCPPSAARRDSKFLEVIPKDQNLGVSELGVCRPAENERGEHIESLAAWRFYAKTANEILKQAEALHRAAKNNTRVQRKRLSTAWQQIRSLIDDWLFIAPMQVGCMLQRGRLTVGLKPVNELSSLSAVVAAQTLSFATRSSGLTTCSACGRLCLPSLRIQEGRRRYCSNCGRRAAQRDASRDYRSRRREVRGNGLGGDQLTL